MTATITAAFIHHAAAFIVVATLMVELVLLKGDLTPATARSVLRVFYTEKGAAYYFASGSFLAKLTLFIVVGLLSIYPTVQFLGWRKALHEGHVPDFGAGTRRKV